MRVVRSLTTMLALILVLVLATEATSASNDASAAVAHEAIAASPDSSGHITGRVTGPDGATPLVNIIATADLLGDPGVGAGGSDITGSDGSYDIGGLDPGAYVAKFYSIDQPYLFEYYNDAADQATATHIIVAAGETVSGIDVSLSLGAAIRGVLTDASDGQPLSSAAALLWQQSSDGAWQSYGQSTTNVYGMYRFPGLHPGAYRLGIFYAGWPPTFYDNASSLETATDIVLVTGAVFERDIAISASGPTPPPPSEIPEPATILLMGSGIAGLALAAWRERCRKDTGVTPA